MRVSYALFSALEIDPALSSKMADLPVLSKGDPDFKPESP
jgi:hypothetical protein